MTQLESRLNPRSAVVRRFFLGMLALATLWSSSGVCATAGTPVWDDFVEEDFPFFSSVLDARQLGGGWPTNNLTPRGLILNLGQGCWACFDTDLLRVSAIWSGKAVTPVSMSQGSYHSAGTKAPEGQRKLPVIDGSPWLANGIYPGWQVGERLQLADPRDPGPDPNEVGRGPLPRDQGRFRAIQLTDQGVVLEYKVAGARIHERMKSRLHEGQARVQRSFRIEQTSVPLILALGSRSGSAAEKLEIAVDGSGAKLDPASEKGPLCVRIAASAKPVEFQVAFSLGGRAETWPESWSVSKPVRRWPERVETTGTVARTDQDAFVVEDITIPSRNPWRRNVRLADLAFQSPGRAAAVTFDGDVWFVEGLTPELKQVRWTRFASGLHEPLGICWRQGELYVNDRNGIWRLRDTDGNGEADRHELFSNAFTQTAETREFATGFRLAPDGSFVIAKGGQQTSTIGRDNGTVMRVSADGQTSAVLGWGLREPFIGVHPRTGLITASDQQGHYVPATPLHIIRDEQFYGFISLLLPKERYPAPIADPLTWIPHAVNASGASQVWLTDARMGPLNEALVHLGYFRPEVFVVRWNERGTRPQAAVMSLTRSLNFPPLNGAINPADGQLYLTGMQIWGTIAPQISGLARIRHTGRPNGLPREVAAMAQGILLRFDEELAEAEAMNVASYSLERWNYRRTADYGSPHFRLDGSKGQETLFASGSYLSKDRRSVFVAVPGMKRVMQMRLGWSLRLREGRAFAGSAYFTPHELTPFDPEREGFGALQIDLTPRAVASTLVARTVTVPVTAEEGRRVAELMGCVACHSDDGTTIGKVGPTWRGVFGSVREIAGQGRVPADEAYLRESIQNPPAKVLKGFENGDVGMPSYEGVLTDAQVEALILYLKTLR